MFWEILLGFFGAVILLILLSLVLGSLTRFYHGLYEKKLAKRGDRSEMVSIFARFSAVGTILLMLALILFLKPQ